MSILAGIAVGLILTALDLEAFGFGLGGAVALLHVFVAPGIGLVLFVCGIRRQRAIMRRLGLAFIFAAIASLVVSAMLGGRKVAESKAAGDALCLALESCRKSDGRYPQQLQELVPSFLSAVPATSMGLLSSIPFDYQPAPEGDDYTLGFNSTFFICCARGPAGTWRCDD